MKIEQAKFLVTGGGGFLGRYIISGLEKKGVFRKNIFSPNSTELDLRSFVNCQKAVDGIDIVIHAAGITGDAEFHQNHPGKIFYDNLIMGTQLLEAARRSGVKKFVSIGSATEYPKDAPMPLKEADLWNGLPENIHAPYAMAKKMLLVQEQAYRSEFGFHGIHLLLTSMYGPGSKENSGPIPSFIKRISEAKKAGVDSFSIWGTGAPMRDFLYIEDAAEGILLAAERYDSPEPVNLGSGDEVSIKTVAGYIADIMGFRGRFLFDSSKPDGQSRRILDITRARQGFGFSPSISMEDGLRKTIKWYNHTISI